MALSPTLLPIPYLDLRWVHAGAQHLSLLPNPITTASTTYKAFSPSESERIEERWVSMSEEERRTAIGEWGQGEGEGAPKKEKKEKEKENQKDRQRERDKDAAPVEHPVDAGKEKEKADGTEVIRSGEEQKDPDLEGRYKDLVAQAQKEYENLELVRGVPVSQDSLFEVHLPSLSLHPVFWAHTGPRVSVLRGSWFVTDDSKPCSWDLAEEIEKAYQEIRPWQPSYKHELATAVSQGPAAEEKLKYALPARFGLGLGIIFEDGEKGRLETAGALSYISKTFWSSLRARPSGTYVYRGYSAARLASGKDKEREPRSGSVSRRGSMASLKKPDVEHPSGSRRGSAASARRPEMDAPPVVVEAARDKSILNTSAIDEENIPVVDDEEEDTPCTDLILVVHGIGQQLATQYEAYNFVYAGNQLRQVIRNQSKNPALASIVRDRRIQVLPVQWRASLQLDQRDSEEDQEHGMDNRFTMADITINKSIPYVRELTNSVLLDIPLFMSQHRLKMIEAVCLQSNKLYRLWMARNPGWKGRIHLIGHSLGSALVAHILSNQPTKMPELSALPKQVILKTKDRFIFNTSNFFVAGSPLGIFLHLDQAQIMPRKGRERTMHSPQDEALDRAGKFGCMAIDSYVRPSSQLIISFYNVFYFSDPVAYQLNAAVDCELSKKRQPLAISSVGSSFSVNSISQYLPVALRKQLEGKPQRPGAIRLPSGLEMLGPNGKEKLQGSRGERRFSALNPHGSVDFYLPSSGPSEYLDMITSHASYWTDASFAAFLLAETFSTRLDLMRTGLGLALDPALTST